MVGETAHAANGGTDRRMDRHDASFFKATTRRYMTSTGCQLLILMDWNLKNQKYLEEEGLKVTTCKLGKWKETDELDSWESRTLYISMTCFDWEMVLDMLGKKTVGTSSAIIMSYLQLASLNSSRRRGNHRQLCKQEWLLLVQAPLLGP